MTRRERAIERVCAGLRTAEPSELYLACMQDGIDAYETELAADLGSEETVERMARWLFEFAYDADPPEASWSHKRGYYQEVARAALRTVLEE